MLIFLWRLYEESFIHFIELLIKEQIEDIECKDNTETSVAECPAVFDFSNVYWIKRNTEDYAILYSNLFPALFYDDSVEQTKPIGPEQTDRVLQYGPNGGKAEETFTGCETINSQSCDTIWSPMMKTVSEPNGGTVYIPWLKFTYDWNNHQNQAGTD